MSSAPLSCSSIYETEPVGPSTHFYLNAVVKLQTDLSPDILLARFKRYESQCGRDMNAPRWSDRIIDLDIIAYGRRIISTPTLTIPHPEYPNRLFVLRPLQDIAPEWKDPQSGKNINEMIIQAPQITIEKSKWHW